MKKTIALIGLLAAVCTALIPGSLFGAQTCDKTLSPYFFLETEASGTDSFPLKKTDVNVTISGVIADVTVRQQYANMGGTAINGRYIFPGSTRAAVHGMQMIIGERVITAKIKEKEEARKIFDTAKKEGKGASLLEQQRPNVFSMDVANIMPGDTVEIELRYTELLVPEDGTYEFVYPTVVGPRYSSTPAAEADRNNQWVQNPYLKQGSEPRTGFDIAVDIAAGMTLQQVSCPSHDTRVDYEDATRARITLSDATIFSGDRDYVLRYRLSGQQIASGLILQRGENENFFLLMAQPPERPAPALIPPREYIFVVDVSGSMHGFPLDTAKELLADLISSLKPTDTFNVLLFAGGSQVMAQASIPASTGNINRAVTMINNSNGGGGTELLQAMQRAMSLPRREEVSRTMVVVTDGYIEAERDVFEAIRNNLNRTNFFTFGIGSSVNRFLIEGMARSGQGEPFVVNGPEEAGPAARKFRDYIASPVLTQIALDVHGLEIYDVEPPAIPDLFAQRPVIVFGKWRGNASGTIDISGKNGEGEFRRTFTVQEPEAGDASEGLAHLWARSRIARISDVNPRNGDPENRSEIVSLGLTYNLLTAFTSFVAVDEVVRNPAGDSRDVKQPLPLPKGVSNLAVGGEMSSMPEPGLIPLMCLLVGLAVISGGLKRRLAAANQLPDNKVRR